MDRIYENGSAPHKIACNLCNEEFYSVTAHETKERHQRLAKPAKKAKAREAAK